MGFLGRTSALLIASSSGRFLFSSHPKVTISSGWCRHSQPIFSLSTPTCVSASGLARPSTWRGVGHNFCFYSGSLVYTLHATGEVHLSYHPECGKRIAYCVCHLFEHDSDFSVACACSVMLQVPAPHHQLDPAKSNALDGRLYSSCCRSIAAYRRYMDPGLRIEFVLSLELNSPVLLKANCSDVVRLSVAIPCVFLFVSRKCKIILVVKIE